MKYNLKKFLLVAAALTLPFLTSAPVSADAMADENGMISKKSHFSVKETLDKLEAVLKKKGIGVALRWSHDAKAKGVGIPLRPTELLVFGNPKLGSHMFTANQTAGIDLPLKALAWKDDKGQVWLTYNDPAYIVKRHNIKNRSKIQAKMTGALNKLTNVATGIK